MKNTSRKMKSIYALAVVALMCVCMLFIPAKSKTVNAETPEVASEIVVKSAQISVNSEKTVWALMFKVQIDKTTFNLLTNDGKDAVKFGTFIGPKDRLDAIKSASDPVAEATTQEFLNITNVGTQKAVNASKTDDCVQIIDYGTEPNFYYYAGVRYDEEYLESEGLSDFKAVSKLEIVAIPCYTDAEGTTHLILDNAKSVTPMAVLTESYLLQQSSGVDYSITEDMLDTFVGEINYNQDTMYLCKDTGRLMKENPTTNNLEPYTIENLETTSEIFISSRKISVGTLDGDETKLDTTKFNDDDISKLASNDVAQNFTVYQSDGTINNYKIKIAQRVIMRWTKSGRYIDTTNAAASDLNDYLTFEDTATGGLGVGHYKSIFFVSANNSHALGYSLSGTTQNMPIEAVEGLYVLANNLTPSENMARLRTHNGSMQELFPREGFGFAGTFDGRGKTIYTKNVDTGHTIGAYRLDPIFPSVSGGTIKNTGFVYHTAQGYYQPTPVFSTALGATFENIYVKVEEISQIAQGNNNMPVISSMQNCVIKNFVIEADGLDTTVAGIGKNSGQHFNSLILFHNFNDGYFSKPTAPSDDIFAGNTATNLFAIGSTKLFAKQEATGANEVMTNNATYLVNPYSELAQYDGQYLTEASELSATALDELKVLTNLASLHKTALYALASAPETSTMSVRVVAQEGFYDMANADEFATFIKDAENATTINKFSTTYWNVDTTNGTVAWKSL